MTSYKELKKRSASGGQDKRASLSTSRLVSEISRRGGDVGDGVKRLVIPKSRLSREALDALDFEEVLISVPERGQRRFRSLRHPSGLHAHDHGDDWVMHRDMHAPSGLVNTVKHVVTEGAPALAYTAFDRDVRPMIERVPRWK